jgi:glutathione S-transferase-like protein
MKLYVCRGTFREPFHQHPCRVAHRALLRAGYEPEVVKTGGFGVGPRFLQWTTAGRRKVEELSGQRVVPVLVTGEGEVLVESARIVEWAEAHPKGPRATGHLAGRLPSSSDREAKEGNAVNRLRQMWKQLPYAHRKWIVGKAVIATAAFNLMLNGAIAWLGVQGQEEVHFWGTPLVETSIFWNVLGTLFLLPLITCGLVMTAVRRDVALGSLTSLSGLRAPYPSLSALPSGRLQRGLTLGVMAVIGLAPPLIIGLVVSGLSELTQEQFVVYQAAFAVTLGAVVTPIIALYAMADPSEAPQ